MNSVEIFYLPLPLWILNMVAVASILSIDFLGLPVILMAPVIIIHGLLALFILKRCP